MNSNRRLVVALPGLVLSALALIVMSAAAQTVPATRPVAATAPVAVAQPVVATPPVAAAQPVVAAAPVAKPALAVSAVAPAASAPIAMAAPESVPQVAPLLPEPPQPPQAVQPAQTPKPAQPAQPPQPPQPSPAPVPPALAPPREPVPDLNVKVEVTITDQTEANPPVKKSIGLTVAEGRSGSVRSGVTVPLLSTSSGPTASGSPVASYNYRNMGLSLDVRNVSVRGNTVALNLSVEYNPVDEKTSGASTAMATTIPSPQVPPSFATFQQSLSLVLESGKPLVVAQSSDPVPGRDRKTTLEVKATILK